jgi:Holliday junction resolvase RusA-like endonuclease
MTYEFSVPGRPHPTIRARPNGHGGVYDPARNRVAKDRIGWAAKLEGVRPMSGPVEVWVNFVFARPKSHLRRDGSLKASAPVHHVQVPDVDNLVKTVKDGLKGIAWKDDCQVVAVHGSKCWADGGDGGGTVVTIETVEGN